jgi:hypothetical protein
LEGVVALARVDRQKFVERERENFCISLSLFLHKIIRGMSDRFWRSRAENSPKNDIGKNSLIMNKNSQSFAKNQ